MPKELWRGARIVPRRFSVSARIHEQGHSLALLVHNIPHQTSTALAKEDVLYVPVITVTAQPVERQLDDLREDRDRWREQATRLLPAPQLTARRGFWRSLFRK